MDRNLIFFLLFDAADSGGGGGAEPLGELAQDLADLNDDGGEEESSEEEGEESESEEGEEEEGEEEGNEEEEEEDEEEEEEEEEGEGKGKKKSNKVAEERDANGRPTVKALKAAYPDIFKKFPELRSAFFEYPKYAAIFPDVETAESAAAKAGEFDALESSLVGNGDPTPLITVLSENNPKALAKVVQNFGEAVRKVDPKLYIEIANPVIEELLYHAAAHGTKTGNKNLTLAARHVANFVFANGGEIPDITKRAKASNGPSEEEQRLSEERAAFAKEKFQGAASDVSGRIDREINAIISDKLDRLTPFERKALIREARQEIDSILLRDTAFQKRMKGLWNRAAEENYSDASKSRIRKAWLERATTVAPSIRNRLRQEALSARNSDEGNGKDNKGKKRQFTNSGGRAPRNSSRVLDPKQIDWKGKTDRELLDM